MEHRWHERVPRRLNVVIHESGSTLVNGITRDISCGGISLETRGRKPLSRNTVVRVALKASGQLLILPSLVLRTEENVAALMFTDQASARLGALKAMLEAVERRHGNSADTRQRDIAAG